MELQRRWDRRLLLERKAVPVAPPSWPASRQPAQPASSLQMAFERRQASRRRHQRIEELQRQLIDHDEERLGRLAVHTAPLTGLRGQAVLPVPPLPVDDLRLPLDLRLRLAVTNKPRKGFRRPWLMAMHRSVREAQDEPLHLALDEAMGAGFDAPRLSSSFKESFKAF